MEPARPGALRPGVESVAGRGGWTLVICEQRLLRECLRELVESTGGTRTSWKISPADALPCMPDDRIEAVIADSWMPGTAGHGHIAAFRAQWPGLRLLLLLDELGGPLVEDALLQCADGYVALESSVDELRQALRKLASGERFLCARTTKRLEKERLLALAAPFPNRERITARQREVLALIAQGLTNKRIAESIGRSVKTVEKHRAELMGRLGLHNSAALTRFALQNGFESTVGARDRAPPPAMPRSDALVPAY